MNKKLRDFLFKVIVKTNFLFPDKLYLEICYYLSLNKRLNLSDPKTMNEKIQWLKLYYRCNEFTQIVDKLTVKKYIENKIGRKYVVPLLDQWSSLDEISIENLPSRFVLKSNCGGGNNGVIICRDKDAFDLTLAKQKLAKSIKSDIYKEYREWPYRNIKKMFFAEELLGDSVEDYKFYCFDGYVDSVLVCIDRQIGDKKFYFFDRDWNLKRYNKRGKEAPSDFRLPKPPKLEEMFLLAEKLSSGFPMVRVDLYNVDGTIYFGEMTFYPASGYDANRLVETDYYFGSLIHLPQKIK